MNQAIQLVECRNCGELKPKRLWCRNCTSGGAQRRKRIAQARAEEMADRYQSGATLQEIGDYYGISRERVRQLMTRNLGITGKDGGRVQRAVAKRKARKARKEMRCLQKWGMPLSKYRELRALDKNINKTPVMKFVMQRKNARDRGVEWKLTFAEWWSVWEQSGKWADRGRGRGKYVMARHGDSGAYEIGNVKIILFELNNSEYIRRYWKQVRSGERPLPKMPSTISLYDSVRSLEIGDTTTVPITTKRPIYAQTHALSIGRDKGWKLKTSLKGGVLTVTRIK